MRLLKDLPLEFRLRDTRRGESASTRPGPIMNVKDKIGATWIHRTIGRGGYFDASAIWNGEDWEKEEIFIDGLMREIDVTFGGRFAWNGFLSKMILTRPNGERFIRDWSQVYNKWKSIYTKISDNELTNGSGESGVWSDYGTPSTLEQSTTWVNHLTYSIHIITDAVDEGAIIQAGIAIVAGKAYTASAVVNIVTGDWFLDIYRIDTGESLAKAGEDETGESVLTVNLADSNEYSGNIGLRIYSDDSGAEIYVDNAKFQVAPRASNTQWYIDSDSIAEYGSKEQILLLGGATEDFAQAEAQTGLKQWGWVRTLPPDRYTYIPNNQQTRLELFFSGYVMTLANLHTTTTGTDFASDIVSSLVGEAEFITAGNIESNTYLYQIENRADLTLWHLLEEITEAGDGSGNLWECGVYENQEFIYQQVDVDAVMNWRNGLVLSGGVLLDPWEVKPGYIILDEMPIGPEGVRAYDQDNPRMVYMFDVQTNIPDWLEGKPGINWIRDKSHE
jgi:hypothetical protein